MTDGLCLPVCVILLKCAIFEKGMKLEDHLQKYEHDENRGPSKSGRKVDSIVGQGAYLGIV